MRLFSNHSALEEIDWQPIAQGSSNKIYRGSGAQQSLILRQNADIDFAFGVDRLRENKVLELIKRQPWAPNIIDNNLEQDWCLMLDHGPMPTVDKQCKTALLDVVNQLQIFSTEVAPSISDSVYFDHTRLFTDYIDFFNKRARLFKHSIHLQQPIHLCQLLLAQLQSLPAVNNVLMHQDLHPGNLCVTASLEEEGNQLILIDWEYAGWGSPWLDAAALHDYFNIEWSEIAALSSFKGMSAPVFKQGLKKALLFNQGIACVWYYLRFILEYERGKIDKKQAQQHQTDMDRQVSEMITKLTV